MNAEPIAILKSLAGMPIPLMGVSLQGLAEGCLHCLTVEQRYQNVETETIEAVYTFPLPMKAVLLSLELEIGERKLRGVVQQKLEAAETYEQAIESGDTAALLEQASDGLYTVSLGNLQPGEQAVIRYRYAELLDLEQGSMRIAVPTAVAPRYGNAGRTLAAHQVPDVDAAASYPCTFALTLRGELATARVHSPTHSLVSSPEGNELRLAAVSGFALDRDLVVLIEGLAGHSQAVVARDADGYVAVASLPIPRSVALEANPVPRAIKLVVDCSGSMGGDSIHQAREALLGVLATLSPADRVSLTRFGSRFEHVTDGLEPVTPARLLSLNQRVRAINADLGGTEMAAALVAAIELPVPAGSAADVLLITDGEIWEIESLLEQLANARHRLFVVAVGSSPVEELPRKVARQSRGACEFVTPGEDTRAAVGRLLVRMGAPALSVAAVQWPQVPAWSVGAGEWVYAGDTLHVMAGFASQPQGTVRVSLVGRAPLELSCPLPGAAATEDTLARVSAMRRLAGLERAAAAVLAERYQLVTRYTSCVVVLERAAGEKSAGSPVLRAVPQMLAAGWGASGSVSRGPAPAAAARPASPLEECALSAPADFVHPIGARPKVSASGEARFSPAYLARTDAGDAFASMESIERRPLRPDIARRLLEGERRKQPLPRTIDELGAIGVEEDELAHLRALVGEGYREADVVSAWLAVCVSGPGGLPDDSRLRLRILRAADRELVRVLERHGRSGLRRVLEPYNIE
jgi:Ca-activated chloride channel family protein